MKKFFKASIFILILFPQLIFANDKFYGEITPIPQDIQKLMTGQTWRIGCPVGFDQLAYLKLSYWGFDNKPHVGELIVYKDIAQDTLDIFKELFQIHFPIESMQLPERFAENDNSDLKANNTSAFYCRPDGQNPKKLSPHSYGLAIDINSVYNPAIVADNKVEPEVGKKYLNRNLHHKGMINEGDTVFLIFTKHGWYWGGFFKEVDYQHFTKVMIKHYLMTGLQYIPPEKQIVSMDQ